VAGLNKIILVGTLLSDPEIRQAMDGVSVTKFRMTVSNYPGTDQNISNIEVVAWRRLAEICGQYLKKGKLTLIEGRIQNRSFEDQDGQRKWVTEVIASNMQMLDGKQSALKKEDLSSEAPVHIGAEEEVEELPEDDLPF
jgi:single-strand DNA-binding protein